MNANLKEALETHAKLTDEKQGKKVDWLRGIITMAAALLAVLISLKTQKSKTDIEHKFFIATIILLSYGILSGSYALYHEVILVERTLKVFYEKRLKLLLNNKNPQPLIENISTGKFYVFLVKSSILSFVCALISLVVYAIYIDIR